MPGPVTSPALCVTARPATRSSADFEARGTQQHAADGVWVSPRMEIAVGRPARSQRRPMRVGVGGRVPCARAGTGKTGPHTDGTPAQERSHAAATLQLDAISALLRY
jgi:hypothetical protein